GAGDHDEPEPPGAQRPRAGESGLRDQLDGGDRDSGATRQTGFAQVQAVARALAHSEASNRAAGAFVRTTGESRGKEAGADALRPAGTLARVFPVDRVRPAAFVTLRFLLPFRDHRARMVSGTDEVWLAHHAPALVSRVRNLYIGFRSTR